MICNHCQHSKRWQYGGLIYCTATDKSPPAYFPSDPIDCKNIMSTIDDPRNQTTRAMYKWRERNEEKNQPRQYLGASIIGHYCERYLWMSFRLVSREKFDGRILRLFDRGQREESVFVSELRGIGCEVHDVQPDGSQFAVEAHGGHFRGHMDGAVLGIPESPGTWHVLEIKTHSSKSFGELQSKGVLESKPQHYAQVQVYMHLTGMTRALYLAVNKDNDEIYQERIEYNSEHAKSILDRAERIIYAPEPPQLISQDPAWYQCKLCNFNDHCHGNESPKTNCRTCAHSTPETDGTWTCEHKNEKNLPFALQLTGCKSHRHFPHLLSNWAEVVDACTDKNWIQYKNKLNGNVFANCEGGQGDYSSEEITECADKATIGAISFTSADYPINEDDIPF